MILIPKLARQLEAYLGFADGRLTVEAELEIMPGKTALSVNGTPPLTEDETARIEAALVIINASFGGRPIIKAPKV